MTLPRSNATITAILGPGRSEDYDVVGTEGAGKWSGDRELYVLETIKTYFAQNEGGLKRFKVTTLHVPLDLLSLAGISLDPGDFVTYSYNGSTSTRKVQNATSNVLPGHPLQTCVAVMEPEAAETT